VNTVEPLVLQDLSPRLPPLREDLRLHEAAPAKDGSPAWLIQDPVTNRFYRIGWLEFECLLRWPGAPAEIAADIAASTPLAADQEQVEDFARFLERHHLLRLTPARVKRLAAEASRPGWKHWRWWLHHYLFIRIPLVRPERWLAERWLAAALPVVRPLFSTAGLTVIVLASLLGIILVARQWDSFTHGVIDSLTLAGLSGFLLALAISKTLHELGHALVATHYGVRVAHMGVALVVLWPMLYTDTSESWKLRSNRQRLAVSAAGISVELALAGLSTLAWALLDDGPLRQATLYLASTGWLLSLALNASPFMRFDGYFIVSDLLDFPNLHERSGAIARVWLRRTLLGLTDPDPEPLSARQRHALIAFALVTWVYRLVVFLGIAVAVYLFFFKVLGLFLFAVELVWFIFRPLWLEISVWRSRWGEVRANRRCWMRLLGFGGLALVTIPWAFDISAPGLAHPLRQQTVFSPFPARVSALFPPALLNCTLPVRSRRERHSRCSTPRICKPGACARTPASRRSISVSPVSRWKTAASTSDKPPASASANNSPRLDRPEKKRLGCASPLNSTGSGSMLTQRWCPVLGSVPEVRWAFWLTRANGSSMRMSSNARWVVSWSAPKRASARNATGFPLTPEWST